MTGPAGSTAPVWLTRRLTVASTWLRAYLPERSTGRRPPVRLHTGPAVSSLVLRLVVVALGFGCALTVVTGPPGWVVVVALLVVLFGVPGSVLAGVVVIVLALLMVFDTDPAAPWRTPLLVAGLPLMMQLAAVAGQASLSAVIELRVLELPLRRYLALQVFAQVLAFVGAMVAGLGWVLPQLMAVAAVSLLALVVFWLPSLGPVRRESG